MNNNEVPVLLLTGYLGSGKTTLLNRILSNKKGIKFAVIVNDIGEVNIDADLIQKGGVVGSTDDSLVPLQNGCICCTLKMDLVQQLHDIVAQGRFDYIVIEASGICEPAPIAQTICSIPRMDPKYSEGGIPKLDSIVTVVDALRMKDEFGSGSSLLATSIGEEDIENLVIQQIEFCNIVLLNKAAEVAPADLQRVKEVVHALQPKAQIIETNYGDVDFDKILNTNMFNFNEVATSAAWMTEIEKPMDEEAMEHELEEEHHHHHHHHDHEHDEEHHHHDEARSADIIITITTIAIATRVARLRNTASVRSYIYAASLWTWLSSTILWLKSGLRTLSVQREFAISRPNMMCATCLSRLESRFLCRIVANGTLQCQRTSWKTLWLRIRDCNATGTRSTATVCRRLFS